MITVLTIVFIIYAFMEGEREADYFHFRWFKEEQVVKDEHIRFMLQRSIVAIIAVGCSYLQLRWFGLILLPALAFVFPFFHDGAYYRKRNVLDNSIYKKGWMDNTTSSSAKISIGPVLRSVFAGIGISISIVADVMFYVIFK